MVPRDITKLVELQSRFTLSELYRAGDLTAAESSKATPSAQLNQKVAIWQGVLTVYTSDQASLQPFLGDITTLALDAIVNAYVLCTFSNLLPADVFPRIAQTNHY